MQSLVYIVNLSGSSDSYTAAMNRMRVGMGRSIEYDAVTCKEHKEHPSALPTAVADARPLAGLMYSERSATPPATRVVAHGRRLLRRASVLVPVGDALSQRSVKTGNERRRRGFR
jgi:hypothetical protein